MKNEKEVIEAALFAAGGAVDITRLSDLIDKPKDETSLIADGLVEEYRERESGIEIIRSRNVEYLMQVMPEYIEYVWSFAPKELPAPVLRILSMIAYHHPLTQSDLVEIWLIRMCMRIVRLRPGPYSVRGRLFPRARSFQVSGYGLIRSWIAGSICGAIWSINCGSIHFKYGAYGFIMLFWS